MIRVLVVDDDFRVADLHARYVGRVPGFMLAAVAHTAAEAAVVREALGRGVVNYLVKPFSESDLAEGLRAYARFHGRLGGALPLSQAEIDRAVWTLHEGDRVDAAVRKGRSSHTAQLVVDAVRGAGGPVTATDVAGRLGLSRATAQRYISDLAADGRVTVGLRYGTTGPPEHLYRWPAPPSQ